MWNKYRNFIAKKAPTPTAVLKEMKSSRKLNDRRKIKTTFFFFLKNTGIFLVFLLFYGTFLFLREISDQNGSKAVHLLNTWSKGLVAQVGVFT